jgi:hypothetical protein
MQVAGFGEMVFELFDFAARRVTDRTSSSPTPVL